MNPKDATKAELLDEIDDLKAKVNQLTKANTDLRFFIRDKLGLAPPDGTGTVQQKSIKIGATKR